MTPSQKFCTVCGAEFGIGGLFCTSCGARGQNHVNPKPKSNNLATGLGCGVSAVLSAASIVVGLFMTIAGGLNDNTALDAQQSAEEFVHIGRILIGLGFATPIIVPLVMVIVHEVRERRKK